MPAPTTRPAEPPAADALADTTYDVNPPQTPAEARRYGIVLQLWVLCFLVIIVSGLLNYLWGFFNVLFEKLGLRL